MTREEAIKILKKCRETKLKYTFYTLNEYQAATDMAIKALEQESCDNAISRKDMLDAIGHGTTYTSEELQKIINGLPEAKAERRENDN